MTKRHIKKHEYTCSNDTNIYLNNNMLNITLTHMIISIDFRNIFKDKGHLEMSKFYTVSLELYLQLVYLYLFYLYLFMNLYSSFHLFC